MTKIVYHEKANLKRVILHEKASLKCFNLHEKANMILRGGIFIFIYPENLSQKPKLWLWHLKDISLIGIFGMISIFLYMQINFIVPGAIVIAYAIMTVRFDDE